MYQNFHNLMLSVHIFSRMLHMNSCLDQSMLHDPRGQDSQHEKRSGYNLQAIVLSTFIAFIYSTWNIRVINFEIRIFGKNIDYSYF